MTPTVLITGASQGIGKATALLFAKNGYDLVIASRNVENLEVLAKQIEGMGRKVLAIPTDVSEIEQVERLINQALEYYEHIDVLVNNAGVCMTGAISQTDLADWQRVINVNLWGYINTIHTLLPHFLAKKKGTIVNVGSIGGKIPLPNMTVYCTSKYAVTGMSETLRIELEPKGINVCAVHPSATNSDFMSRAVFKGETESQAQQARQQMSELLKSPIASKPEDVAQAIWKTVKNPQAEVVVGTGVFPTYLYKIAPRITQWFMQQATVNNEQ